MESDKGIDLDNPFTEKDFDEESFSCFVRCPRCKGLVQVQPEIRPTNYETLVFEFTCEESSGGCGWKNVFEFETGINNT